MRILVDQFGSVSQPDGVFHRRDQALLLFEQGMDIVDLHAGEVGAFHCHPFFEVRQKTDATRTAHQPGNLHRLSGSPGDGCQREGQQPSLLRPGNEQDAVAQALMAVLEKIVVGGGMLGEHQNMGTSAVGRGDDIPDFSPAVMRKSRVDMQVGAEFLPGGRPGYLLAQFGPFGQRLAHCGQSVGSHPVEGIGPQRLNGTQKQSQDQACRGQDAHFHRLLQYSDPAPYL